MCSRPYLRKCGACYITSKGARGREVNGIAQIAVVDIAGMTFNLLRALLRSEATIHAHSNTIKVVVVVTAQ